MPYVTISIPSELAKAIDEHIKKSSLGYRNRTEYVIETIRKEIKNQ